MPYADIVKNCKLKYHHHQTNCSHQVDISIFTSKHSDTQKGITTPRTIPQKIFTHVLSPNAARSRGSRKNSKLPFHYLYDVAEVAARRAERQLADVRHLVLLRTMELQVVGLADVPIVRSVAGCNTERNRISVGRLYPATRPPFITHTRARGAALSRARRRRDAA